MNWSTSIRKIVKLLITGTVFVALRVLGDSLNLPDHRIHKDGDGDSLFQLKSDSLPHAHAQTTKTYYKHQDSRIKKAQTQRQRLPQTLIYKIFLQLSCLSRQIGVTIVCAQLSHAMPMWIVSRGVVLIWSLVSKCIVFGISGLLHQVITTIADKIRVSAMKTSRAIGVHVNDVPRQFEPSWGNTLYFDTLNAIRTVAGSSCMFLPNGNSPRPNVTTIQYRSSLDGVVELFFYKFAGAL
ncbi:hypothetical protein Tco_0837413 [Tanacetum coccineum]